MSLDTHARLALDRSGIPVYAPAGVAERAGLDGSPVFEWHRVTAWRLDRGRWSSACSFRRTDHSFETLAVRIDGEVGALGYSADTGPGWSLAELGTGLDLVLCEATYTVEHEGTAGHYERTPGRGAGPQGRSPASGPHPPLADRRRRRPSPRRPRRPSGAGWNKLRSEKEFVL